MTQNSLTSPISNIRNTVTATSTPSVSEFDPQSNRVDYMEEKFPQLT